MKTRHHASHSLEAKSNSNSQTASAVEQTDFADFEKAFSNATSDLVACGNEELKLTANEANFVDVAEAAAWEMQTDAVATHVEDLLTKEDTIDDEPEKPLQQEGWANFDHLN